ncbi:hypothetical protein CSKR_111211 [Clonorchis sinensis]|uniref:Uncharacterized protein n=1 Tax=Clonorchis sinensis TaxID=79923 RepID=A0A3R7FSE5_CLOSI|nr:hypothetical protein CSKR_111211 [Clonorchis sinensis]
MCRMLVVDQMAVDLFAELGNWLANVLSQRGQCALEKRKNFGCWSVHRVWQLSRKRFITDPGDIVSAGLSGSINHSTHPTPH